ncbi:hypothetical protein L1049_010620 [Liquidambar formosana]|uniref:Uncharacterized protein n=1 Tax=Liquidambar formosana TaxID=63359 RepID=A0AAP0N8V2_LIQFO
MSKLKKAIFRGDFDESSYEESRTRKMVQYIASEFHRRLTKADNQQSKHGGSRKGRQHISRDRISGHKQLIEDYFAENPTFPANYFRRRFRMSRPLFLRILNEIQQFDDYFVQRRDATGAIGFSGIQKMTVALRMLAYGIATDSLDEYARMA